LSEPLGINLAHELPLQRLLYTVDNVFVCSSRQSWPPSYVDRPRPVKSSYISFAVNQAVSLSFRRSVRLTNELGDGVHLCSRGVSCYAEEVYRQTPRLCLVCVQHRESSGLYYHKTCVHFVTMYSYLKMCEFSFMFQP
jgi:hypothetical protein